MARSYLELSQWQWPCFPCLINRLRDIGRAAVWQSLGPARQGAEERAFDLLRCSAGTGPARMRGYPLNS